MFASAVYDEPLEPWLRTALLPTLPIARIAVCTAILASRWKRVPAQDWDDWLAFPVSSVMLATAGVIVSSQVDATQSGSIGVVWAPVFQRLGGLLMGLGIVLAVLPASRCRWAAASAIGLFVAVVINPRTAGAITLMYAFAVALWWAQRAWQLLRGPLRDVHL